jgi:hypothetical protein
MTKHTLLILALLLNFIATACNYTTQAVTPRPLDGETQEPNSLATITETPEVTPTYEGCYYVWASQDLPGLSNKVLDALQAMDKNITGGAYAYGENCVYADGHATFGAMETDFSVKVKVKDLKDEKALGDSIAKAMKIILQLPRQELPGPQRGRVDFVFSKSDSEQLYLTVSIERYEREAVKLTGAELFKHFYKKP